MSGSSSAPRGGSLSHTSRKIDTSLAKDIARKYGKKSGKTDQGKTDQDKTDQGKTSDAVKEPSQTSAAKKVKKKLVCMGLNA